jgi:hypothetical protein
MIFEEVVNDYVIAMLIKFEANRCSGSRDIPSVRWVFRLHHCRHGGHVIFREVCCASQWMAV